MKKIGHQDPLWVKAIIHALLITACLITIYPILRIMTISLRPGDRLMSTSLAIIPPDATFLNYKAALFEKDFLLWLWNSLVITLATAVIGLSLASTSAYAISRWKFPGRNAMLIFLLGTQMIPAAMLMVPLYLLAAKFGLINTYRGLVIAYSVSAVPFSIWILKGYYDSIPTTLEEAAMIDGASRMYTFWKIILPLTTPALAIAFLFNFMNSWNEFMLARIMLPKAGMFTWPLGLQSLQGQFTTQWGVYAASSMMISVPVVALFLYSSKWLVNGLTAGSVKG
ncbi:MAG: sugar ABC transporter permease [Spirochaetales bacterium]|nr:sugar ABC transporter permease [Spirochaetales bacterium]